MLCPYCLNEYATTWDHILPKSRNGSNDTRNLIRSCRGCNESKGHTISRAWLDKLQTETLEDAVSFISEKSIDGSQLKFKRIVNKILSDREKIDRFIVDIHPMFKKRI